MVKRVWCLILMLLCLPCMALASSQVVDDAGLFTKSEIRQMEEVIQRIQDEYQMDVVILTSYDVGYNDSQDFADLYYERGGYGLGDDDAGLLYLIDMRNRVPCISTSGVMIDFITDSRLETLFDCSYDALARGEYGTSAMQVLNQLERSLAYGRQEGSFRYDAETGKRLSGLYNRLTLSEVIMAALVSVIVVGSLLPMILTGYSVSGRNYCYSTADASCELTHERSQFLRQDVIRTRNPPPSQSGGSSIGSGSGSSVHRSSSGGSHGGGVGRKF